MKKTQEIATNSSAGAEKVETIAQEKSVKKSDGKTKTVKTSVKETSAKGDAALGDSTKAAKKLAAEKSEKIDVKKMNAETGNGAAEKESEAAKARVEAALKRKEEQAKRKEERLAAQKKKSEARAKKKAERRAAIEKRKAEKKALIEKRAAEKKALAEKRAAEKEARLTERAHAKANKNQAQSKKKTQKAQRKTEKKDKRERHHEHAKGYGGWLAAVVSLGVVTLALTTAVTVGAIDMRNTKNGMMAAHKGTMYELTGIMEHVDDDLDRVRISASPAQQSRILTDLLVQARLAELDLEKLPISAEADRNITEFINRTAAECERMLAKLRNGGELSEEDKQRLEGLYKINHSIRMELDGMMEKLTDKDLRGYLKDGAGMVGDALGRLENLTLEENRAMMEDIKDKMTGAGMRSMPKEGASGMTGADGQEGAEAKLDPARAEELCNGYFSDYGIKEFQCVGETVNGKQKAYNVQGYDEKGTLLFAEVDQQNGALIRFDYYEDCNTENFDLKNAERIAEQFLEKLGYDDLEIVRFRESGTTTDFTFVYEDDDVVYYPDEVRVKVCRTRGVVTAMDASKYLRHHKERKDPVVLVTLAEAYDKLYDGLEVEASRLAVVKTARGEKTAYEFLCSYGEEQYFVYLSAETGEEISIVNAKSIS
ncbi:MAG: germination protein YpeB [Clostridia bacterium]|nr:germination protein YpeB [Clostridia bacterium]